MANAQKVQEGSILNVTAGADIDKGDTVRIGDIVGITTQGAANGELCAVETEGVFEVDKATGETWSPGEDLFHDIVAGNYTTTGTDNKWAGRAVEDAASGATRGKLALGGVCYRENTTS